MRLDCKRPSALNEVRHSRLNACTEAQPDHHVWPRLRQPHSLLSCCQGPNGELATAALALAELDVSDTLIGSWHAALRIMRQLPALRQIDLSRTRLALPAPAQPPAAGLAADRLQTLVLNECRLTWAEVKTLTQSFCLRDVC